MINLCGENGLINQINDVQKQINQFVFLGKNAIAGIQTTIATVKTIAKTLKSDPRTVLRTIQADVLQVVSAEALKNPDSALAKVLEIKNAYESAGPAVDRIIGNIESFIKDPLNVPLDVCNDIPNLKRVGDAVIAVVNPAKVPAPDASPKDIRDDVAVLHEQVATVQATVSEEELKNKREQTIPTVSIYPLPDVGEDRKLAGRTPPERVYNPKPGDAHAAAIYGATGQKPAVSTNPTTGETKTAKATPPAVSTKPVASTPPPQKSLANPFPAGKQYVAADFAPSKYAASIAQKLNTLDPAVRGSFAAGIQDYIKTNFKDGRDVSIGEAYRSPERSAQLAASGIRAAGAGKSWHNYGAACDLCIFVNGKWDQGTRGETEYTGRARASMSKFGLINDLRGDSGHFYIQSFGAGVPKAVQEGKTTLASLAKSKGTALA
jgi:uncharacterized protein YcbK (DUF882 family)